MPGWVSGNTMVIMFAHISGTGVRWVEASRDNNGITTPALRWTTRCGSGAVPSDAVIDTMDGPPEFLPLTNMYLSPACPLDSIDNQLYAISQACCTALTPCNPTNQGVPAECTFDCNRLFAPFMANCNDTIAALVDHGDVTIPGANTLHKLHQYTQICGQFSVASMAAAIYDSRCGVCGDNSVDDWLAEGCDAGAANADTPDAPCRSDCTLPRCGDSVQDSGEGCDDGAANGPDGACGLDCQPTCAFADSEIIAGPQCAALAGYYGDASQQWTKCYTTTGGDTAITTFHSQCDPYPETITLVADGPFIFGGYGPKPWDASAGEDSAGASFLFTLAPEMIKSLPPGDTSQGSLHGAGGSSTYTQMVEYHSYGHNRAPSWGDNDGGADMYGEWSSGAPSWGSNSNDMLRYGCYPNHAYWLGANVQMCREQKTSYNGRSDYHGHAVDIVEVYRKVRPPGCGPGVTYHRWNGISGTDMAVLLNSDYTSAIASAAVTAVMPMFESPVNVCDNCGTMMEGYFRAATDGGHTFRISADDNAHLWIGADVGTAMASTEIASVPGWTSNRQWYKYAEQEAAPVTLTAGSTYYMRATANEGGGGDNLEVGVTTPTGEYNPISGWFMDTCA